MSAALTLGAAYLLDLAVGDPPALPHPVRAIGGSIAFAEARLNAPGRSARLRGAWTAIAVIAGAFAVGCAIERCARRVHPAAGAIASVVLAASTFATTDLLREARAVERALRSSDIAHARSRLARIVGRDTAELDASEIARATIETLAESACDGIVAPLFWCAVGGAPAALAFKAASTLDSMIGHRTARFERFGAFAARVDDLANFAPARLTAVLIALASRRPQRSFRAALADASAHASPNAGWPEAAMAGSLGVRLGGTNAYDGVVHDGPLFFAAGRAAQVDDIVRAMSIVRIVSLAAAALAVAARA